jgi:hypothetical protein
MSPQCHGTLLLLDFDKRFGEFGELCHFDNMSPLGHTNYKLKNSIIKPWLNLCELVMG